MKALVKGSGLAQPRGAGNSADCCGVAFGSFLRTTMVNKIGELVPADIRRAVFSHVMTLSATV